MKVQQHCSHSPPPTNPTRVHTLSEGAPGAPLVVLAHGLEGCWKFWKPLAACLDPSWRLVALELPWKSGNDYAWRVRASWKWLGDGLDQIDATPDLLVAHSFGATTALELLCRLDPRVGRAAALVCPLYRSPRVELTWRLYDRSRETFLKNIGDGVRAKLGSRAQAIEPDVFAGMVRVAADRAGPLGFGTMFDRYAASAELPLGNIERPVRVLAGGADPTLPAETAEALAAAIPGAGLRIYDGCDHFFYVRHARDVAAEVIDLVGATRARTTTIGELR